MKPLAPARELLEYLQDLGYDTGVDLDALMAAGHLAEELVGRQLPSAVLRAGPRTRTAPPSRSLHRSIPTANSPARL